LLTHSFPPLLGLVFILLLLKHSLFFFELYFVYISPSSLIKCPFHLVEEQIVTLREGKEKKKSQQRREKKQINENTHQTLFLRLLTKEKQEKGTGR